MNTNIPIKVLVAPLNWGLGHATRCVPIINELIKQNAEVIIGSDGNALKFLQKEFPNLTCVNLPNSEIKYYNSIPAWLSVILQIPKFIYQIYRDKKIANDFLKKNHIDIIISDNRYGLYSSKVRSVIITHQIQIKNVGFEFIPNYFIRNFISKFNLCLIPDFESVNESLAGNLSHGSSIIKNTIYIGPLSRFNFINQTQQLDVIPVIISGPNPLKSKIQKTLIDVLATSNYKFLIISGDVILNKFVEKGNIKIVSHLNSDELEKTINNSPLIISTGGYSSIMDYYKMQKKTIFIPFPGQTEQEYLAKHLNNYPLFSFLKYKHLKKLPELIHEKIHEKIDIEAEIKKSLYKDQLSNCISQILKIE